MAELLGGEKLPKMDVLKEKRRQLAARKKALYLEYRKAQQDMRELVAVKGSVDHLRGLTDHSSNSFVVGWLFHLLRSIVIHLFCCGALLSPFGVSL